MNKQTIKGLISYIETRDTDKVLKGYKKLKKADLIEYIIKHINIDTGDVILNPSMENSPEIKSVKIPVDILGKEEKKVMDKTTSKKKKKTKQKYINFYTYKSNADKYYRDKEINIIIDKEYSIFSNFSSNEIDYKGLKFPSNEHAFQWEKFNDDWYKEQIRNVDSPNDAKQLGKQEITKFTKSNIRELIKQSKSKNISIRDDWNEIKDKIMYEINWIKFTENEELKTLLLNTKTKILREASPYDDYWGIGSDGKGKNKLGEILMDIRSKLNKQ